MQENTNVMGRKCSVLLGCTGSVASIKVPQIVDELTAYDLLVCANFLFHNFINHGFAPTKYRAA